MKNDIYKALMNSNNLNDTKKHIKRFQFPQSFSTFKRFKKKTIDEGEGEGERGVEKIEASYKNPLNSSQGSPSSGVSFENSHQEGGGVHSSLKSKRELSTLGFEAEDLNQLFFLAEESFKNNNFQEALHFLNPLVLKNYNKPEVYHMLGTIYYDQGKFNKAVRMFRRALEIDPGFTDSSVGLSILLNDLGRYDEGKEVFERAKTLINGVEKEKENKVINEKLSARHFELGDLYFQYKRYDEALTQYFKALSLNPLKLEIHLSIVDCYLFLKKYDEAIFELKDLCKEEPDFHKARIVLGEIYSHQGDWSQATIEWKEVLKKDPHNVQVKLLLKRANQELKY